MTDLRTTLIEAGVERIHNKWHSGKSPQCLDCREDVQLIIDAFLDTLADRADEWWVEAAEGRAVDCRVEHWVHEPESLIAVLRGDTE